jgi:hypothetical protein
MSATGTRDRDDAGESLDVATPDSESAASDSRLYLDLQMRTERRKRIAWFAVGGVLWALALIPLARELTEGGATEIVFTYLSLAAASLAVAAAIRLLYKLLTKKPVVSPFLFILAAFLAIVGYVVHTAGAPVEPIASPAAQVEQAH